MAVAIDTPVDLPHAPRGVTIADDLAIFTNTYGGSSPTGALYDPATGTLSTIQLPPGMAAGTSAWGSHGVATVDGKTIFAGGLDTVALQHQLHDATGEAYIYDRTTGVFSSSALSAPRDLITAVSVGHKAVFAGGVPVESPGGAAAVSSAVDIYDASTQTWSTAALSSPSYYIATAVSGTKAYFAPIISTGPHSHLIDVYDSATGQWSTMQPPAILGIESATAIGTKVVFLGESGSRLVNSIPAPAALIAQIYDTISGKWTSAYLGKAGFGSTIGVVGNQIIFAGGTYANVNSTSVPYLRARIFDAAGGRWSSTSIPKTLQGGTSLTVGGRVVFVQPNSPLVAYATIYDSGTRRWSTIQLSDRPDHTFQLQAVGSRAFIYEIDNNAAPENRIDVLSWTESRVVQAPELATPSNGASLGVSPDALTWSSTPGATYYDVYLDDVSIARVAVNVLSLRNTLTAGAHTVRIVARVGRRRIEGFANIFTIRAS